MGKEQERRGKKVKRSSRARQERDREERRLERARGKAVNDERKEGREGVERRT